MPRWEKVRKFLGLDLPNRSDEYEQKIRKAQEEQKKISKIPWKRP